LKILHIITSLGDGGAENTLYKICKYDKKHHHYVISLKKPKKYSFLLKKINIKVFHFNFSYLSIISFLKLGYLIYKINPNIIQTWLIHGDFIGGLAAKLFGFSNIIWNVRYSKLNSKKNLINILLIRILSFLSYLIPKKIIVVSQSAFENCKRLKFDVKNIIMIENGYDLSILKKDKTKKIIFQNKYNINKKKIPIIGNLARYDPMKDHKNLIISLSLIKKRNIDFLCILGGSNIDKKNSELTNMIREYQLTKNVKMIGKQKDISIMMNGIDIYVQSSCYGEGFPNVVAEAMAFQLPCIVTDVGDAKRIILDTGYSVPPNDPYKLSLALEKMIVEMSKKKWKIRCKLSRYRIKKHFGIDRMLNLYSKLWLSI
jgi:glycosyltransferase involved in cell wall biosynthesis